MQEPTRTRPTIFFDMDGVLVRYEPDAYRSTPPAHEIECAHYFRHLAPDEWACDVFAELVAYAEASTTDLDVTVLSRTSGEPRSVTSEQRIDKTLWLYENLACGCGTTYPAISHTSKVDSALRCLGLDEGDHLPASAVLVDDFNENLSAWRDAGGTAVKYLNGINSRESWDGIVLRENVFDTAHKAALQLVVYATSAPTRVA